LSAAKGLGDALSTLTALVDRRCDVTLTLAGPVSPGESQQLIEDVAAKYPGRLRAVGPVYGDDKQKFFAEIDVFLFPTKTESWGLVLNEALAAGVPVITVDRGCTSLVVGNEAGLLIDRHVSFVEPAATQVERWAEDHESYLQASRAAVLQAQRLRDEGQDQLEKFVQHMFSPLPPASANA